MPLSRRTLGGPVSREERLRSGKDYIESIRDDGRHVILHGGVVRDVTSHPAFRGAVRSVAHLWDIAAAPENRDLMT